MTIGQLKEIIEMVGDESVGVWVNDLEISSAIIKIAAVEPDTSAQVLHLTLSEDE